MKMLILFASIYGGLIAVLFNCRYANFADVVIVVLLGHACGGALSYCKRQYENSLPIFSFMVFRNVAVGLLVFLAITTVGVGLFWFRVMKQMDFVDENRNEIELSIRSKTFSCPGVSFDILNENSSFPIDSFYTEDVIVFSNDSTYIAVIPLTRPDFFPSFLSGSKFNALIWNKEDGWKKEKVYWGYVYLGK